MANLSDILRLRRKELGLTLLQIAEAVGVSEATVQRWESGNIKTLRHENLARLADVLKLSPAALMGWEDIPSSSNSIPSNAIEYNERHFAPIVGTIPAGYPALAFEDIEGYADIPYSDEESYFFLRVNGDSMEPKISTGDLVLIRKQNVAEDGQIVAARVNGDEATLKRYKRQGNTILLLPENPKYNPYVVSTKEFETGYAQIIGVAIELRRDI